VPLRLSTVYSYYRTDFWGYCRLKWLHILNSVSNGSRKKNLHIFKRNSARTIFLSSVLKINGLKGKGVAEKLTAEECRQEQRKHPTQDFCLYAIPKAMYQWQ